MKPLFEIQTEPKRRNGTAVILGGGPTGLSTAWRLARYGWKVIIIEKDHELGGHSGTRNIEGYDVDDGPHKLYPQVPCAQPLIEYFLKDELRTIPKKSLIFLRGKYIPFPFGLVDLFRALGIVNGIRCGISYFLGKIEKRGITRCQTYTDFVVAQYGRFAHKLVFKNLAEKLWGDPDTLHIQLAKTRIIAPSISELLKGLILGIRNKPKLNADHFYYPKGGLRKLWEAFGKEIEAFEGMILRKTYPVKIQRMNPDGKFIISYKRNEMIENIEADAVISTIPLRAIFDIMDPFPPNKVQYAINSLKLSGLLMLYLVVDTPRLLPANWIFIPESKYHFGRISEQKGFSEDMVPAHQTVLMVEIPLARNSINNKDQETIIQEAIAQLREINILQNNHTILKIFTGHGASVYPIYDLQYKDHLETILEYSDSIKDFYLNGRHGLFCYNNMDHSMEMGLALADHIVSDAQLLDWQKIRDTFYEYKIVD